MPVPLFGPTDLLANTEVAKDHVEDILDIDPAGEAAESARGTMQFLRQEVFALGHWPSHRPAQRREGFFEGAAVTGAGDQGGVGAGEGVRGETFEGAQQGRNAVTRQRRNTEYRFTVMSNGFILCC